MKPKYYSGTGDDGKTSIAGGRVSKSSGLIKLIGDIDELSAVLGNAASAVKYGGVKDTIKTIEETLYRLSSELSGYTKIIKKKTIKPVGPDDVKFLEDSIEKYSKTLPDLTNFLYPNGSDGATRINVCRTVARRVERDLVEVDETSGSRLQYMNRLSSLLFVLFRYVNQADNVKEEVL